MINLLKLTNLHFNITIDSNIKKLLDKDLFMRPEDLAVHIYRLQREIVSSYQENTMIDILQSLSYLQRIYTQMEIYYSAQIGKNFKIVHGTGVVIGSRVKIGDNVTIFQNVTLGDSGIDSKRPTIEEDVYIYAGAKVLGGVTIAKNSIIGANSLVLKSCTKGSVLVGSPARVVNKDGRKYVEHIRKLELESFRSNKDKLGIFDFNYFKYREDR